MADLAGLFAAYTDFVRCHAYKSSAREHRANAGNDAPCTLYSIRVQIKAGAAAAWLLIYDIAAATAPSGLSIVPPIKIAPDVYTFIPFEGLIFENGIACCFSTSEDAYAQPGTPDARFLIRWLPGKGPS